MHLTKTIEQYKAVKALWDRIVETFLELPPEERQKVIAKLILLEDEKTPPPTSRPRPSGIFRSDELLASHDGDEPRLSDLIVDVLRQAGEPLTQAQIYGAARAIKPDVKKTSIETVTSKMAKRHSEISHAGLDKEGRKLYALAS